MVDDAYIEKRMIELFQTRVHGLFLDLGTGTGRMLEIFAPYIDRGIGIDLSREMLQVARSNLDTAGVTNCTVRRHDIKQLGFTNSSVDAIMIHQVLHYLDSPDEVLTEAIRLLKPGGQLFVVDFLPHDLEFLREEHAHRRLGIAPAFIEQWSQAHGCHLAFFEPLETESQSELESLSIGLWRIEKRSDHASPPLN